MTFTRAGGQIQNHPPFTCALTPSTNQQASPARLVVDGFQPKKPKATMFGRSFQVPCHLPECHSSGCQSALENQGHSNSICLDTKGTDFREQHLPQEIHGERERERGEGEGEGEGEEMYVYIYI